MKPNQTHTTMIGTNRMKKSIIDGIIDEITIVTRSKFTFVIKFLEAIKLFWLFITVEANNCQSEILHNKWIKYGSSVEPILKTLRFANIENNRAVAICGTTAQK